MPWDKVVGEVRTLYEQDEHFRTTDLVVCTEPFAGPRCEGRRL